MKPIDRQRTRDMTREQRRERRSWRARIIGFVAAPPRRPRGRVTHVALNPRGGKEALQKLRRNPRRPAGYDRAVAMFVRIHAERRERNRQRALAKANA